MTNGQWFGIVGNKVSASEYHAEMSEVLKEASPSLRTIQNWFNEFPFGRRDFSMTLGHVNLLLYTTKKNWSYSSPLEGRLTCQIQSNNSQIQHTLGLSSETVNTILHDYQKLQKVCTQWVPHELTEAQKQSQIEFWVHAQTVWWMSRGLWICTYHSHVKPMLINF